MGAIKGKYEQQVGTFLKYEEGIFYMPAGRPKKEKQIPLEDFPPEFRMMILKFMTDNRLDNINEALIKISKIIDEGNKQIQIMAKNKFESWRRKDKIIELNKARSSIKDTEWENGFTEGLEVGKKDFQIQYYCKICGKPITMTPNSAEHKAIIQYLYDNGWAHGECLKK